MAAICVPTWNGTLLPSQAASQTAKPVMEAVQAVPSPKVAPKVVEEAVRQLPTLQKNVVVNFEDLSELLCPFLPDRPLPVFYLGDVALGNAR
jgi:hypothetical protein